MSSYDHTRGEDLTLAEIVAEGIPSDSVVRERVESDDYCWSDWDGEEHTVTLK